MSDDTMYRYLFKGETAVIPMQQIHEHLPADANVDDWSFGTVQPGDEVAFYEPLGLDALHSWDPADQATADVVAAQQKVEDALEPAAPEVAADPDAYPASGTKTDVLAWVDQDVHGRVAYATDQEAAREGGPRSSVIDALAHRAASLTQEG